MTRAQIYAAIGFWATTIAGLICLWQGSPKEPVVLWIGSTLTGAGLLGISMLDLVVSGWPSMDSDRGNNHAADPAFLRSAGELDERDARDAA